MNDELLAKCSCSQCGNHIEFPIEAANVVVDCPHCAQKTQLSLEAPPPTADKPSAAEILAAFNGTIPRTRTSFFYQIGLLLVTAVMLGLPVVYVAVGLAAVWGGWVAAGHFRFLLAATGRGPP